MIYFLFQITLICFLSMVALKTHQCFLKQKNQNQIKAQKKATTILRYCGSFCVFMKCDRYLLSFTSQGPQIQLHEILLVWFYSNIQLKYESEHACVIPILSTGVLSGRKPCLMSSSMVSSSSARISETMLQGISPILPLTSPL